MTKRLNKISCLCNFIGLLLCQSTYSLSQPSISRRDTLLVGGAVGISSLLSGGIDPALAIDGSTSFSNKPVAILGASGRTGALCVTACLERGIPVRALTRTGNWQMPEGKLMSNYNNDLLTVSTCDINDPAALRNTVKGCRGVIYAASASKRGGSAKAIDNEGVVAAGDACIQGNIGRFVVISSTATSRPKSLGYIFTNVFGGVMEEKRKGEQGVMKQYKYATTSGSTYTILRPGGLEEPKENKVLGPSTLEISQGDAIAGIISRADLAQVAVELALCEQSNVQNTAVELYYTYSAQPCEGKFKSLLTSSEGVRLHGNSYEELFKKIEAGIDFYEP